MKGSLDFSDVISFKDLTEGVSYWSEYLHCDKKEDPFLKKHVDMYLEYLYSCSLKFILRSNQSQIEFETYKIMQKYAHLLMDTDLKAIDMEQELLALEGTIMKSLKFGDEIDLSCKNGAYEVLDRLSKCYTKLVGDILTGFSREELIKIFASYANAVSYISVQTFYWENEGDIDRNKMNLISETANLIYKNKLTDLRFFFGENKKVLEYLMHYVLNSNSRFKKSSGKRLDIKQLFYLSILLLTVEQQKRYLNYLYKKGGHIVIEHGFFRIERSYEKEIAEYFESTIELHVDLHSEDLQEIYQTFEQNRGYSPYILEEYLFNYDGKFLETNNILSCIEKDALVEDIYHKTGREREAIRAMLDDLSLRKCSEDELVKQAHSDDNRLFRTPLLNLDNYYLFPFYPFIEASQYFRKRIVKGQLSKPLERNTKRLVESHYDESDLRQLETLLLEKKAVGRVNVELNQYPQCKEMFMENPSLTQEIDFYYIKDNVLFLMELKNRSSDYSLFDIAKSLSVTEKHMKALAGRKTIYLNYKAVLSGILGADFDSVELYLVHKYPSPSDNTYNYEYQVSVFSFDEFYKFISVRELK